MIHSVEELFEIHINDPEIALVEIFLRSFYGLMGTSLLGLNPKLESEKVASQSCCNTCNTACWMNRSSTVGIPSCRIPPPGLGISTRFHLEAVHMPRSLIADGSSAISVSGIRVNLQPSYRLSRERLRSAFTLRRAVNRLSLSTTFSISCSSSTGLAVSAFVVNNPPFISKDNHNCLAGPIVHASSVLQSYHLIPSQGTVQAFRGGITSNASSV